MVTYLMLLNWTDQGIKNVKDSPKRLEGVKKLAKEMGGEVKGFYMTLGAYDLVLIVDMPNNDKLASFGLKLGSLGNVRSTTLKAFSEDDYRRIIAGLNDAKKPSILLLNKIDTIPHDRVLPLIETMRTRANFTEVFMVSAEKGHGIEDLRAYLASKVPAGPWAYPADQAADMPVRLLAAEITRERIYDRLHQELPYASSVVTEQWETMKDGAARLEQTIFVERESQRAIVLGKGGATIKLLGQTARKEMEGIFGHKVHLFLHVKVRENWSEDPAHYREIGLDLPKS